MALVKVKINGLWVDIPVIKGKSSYESYKAYGGTLPETDFNILLGNIEAITDNAVQATTNANEAAESANTAANSVQESIDLATEVATHPPIIQTGTWWNWNTETNQYVDSGQAATPYENYLQNTTDDPVLTEAEWSVWSKEQGDYAKEQGDFAKEQGELAQTAREGIEGDLAAKIDKSSITNVLGDSEELVMSQKGVKTEVQKLQLADTQQSHSIKAIEDTLNTININQEATATAEGYETISLPKIAANGGMSVKLEGLTAENLIVNGDFRNGLAGWSYSAATSISIEYETLRIISDGSSRTYATRQVKNNITDKLYIVCVAKKNENPINLGIGGNMLIDSYSQYVLMDSDDFVTYSLIRTAQSNNEWVGVVRGEGIAVDVSVKYLMGINLTATFGAGNEPTVEECDAMFANYFEGTANFLPTGRVRSVGKNLFDFDYWKNLSNYPTLAGGGYFSGSLQLKPNTTYTFRVTLKGAEKPTNYFQVSGGDGARWTISSPTFIYPSIRSFTTGSDGILKLYVSGTQSLLTTHFETTNFMVVEGEIAAPYEPYKETSLYLTAPELRSNGTVKDEIRKGANGYELVKRISDVDGSVLTTPEIIPISYGGVLNSASNGTVYHEPIIADAGVYDTKMDILLTDYPIFALEEIIVHKDGIDTYLDVSTAVIAADKLSFTHPSLASGDLVLFTYAFDKESTNGNITATFYDSNVVKIDTVTGKAYKIEDVVTNGVLTRTLTEV